MVEKWILKDSQSILQGKIFRYSQRKHQSSEGKEGIFDVLTLANWVNIVAVTQDDLVLIRQYRPGSDSITLEIPGGAIDRNEDPLHAAKRELQEETGYTSQEWVSLGIIRPNPAFMDNVCHLFFAKNCQKTQEQDLDPLEEIEVITRSSASVLASLQSGEIDHALVLCALYRYQNFQRLQGDQIDS